MNYKQRIDEIIEDITKDELSSFLNDNIKDASTVYGKLYVQLEQTSTTNFEYYKDRLAEKCSLYGLITKTEIEKQEDDIDVEDIEDIEEAVKKLDEEYANLKVIDVTTALEECIKPELENSTFFTKAKILETVKELTGEEITLIESETSETQIQDLAEYYDIKEALGVCFSDIKINESMDTDSIWDLIKEDEDFLLESKVKSYMNVKKSNNNMTKNLTKVNSEFANNLSTVMTEEHREHLKVQGINNKVLFESENVDIANVDMFELNKLEKIISEKSKGMTERNSKLIEQGYANYKQLKENYKTQIPQTKDLLSLYIKYSELIDENLIESTRQFIEKLNISSKKLEHKNSLVYKGTDKQEIQEVSFLNDLNSAVLIEERKDGFYWGIKHRSNLTIQDEKMWNKSVQELQERYENDLMTSKKTLEKKFKGKKFVAVVDTDIESVGHYDTNKWRIHFYDDVKREETIHYNLEYYPSNYNKDNPQFNEDENVYRVLDNYIKTNSIFIEDGQVLWSVDGKYMIDTEQVAFRKLFDVFKENNTDNKLWLNRPGK